MSQPGEQPIYSYPGHITNYDTVYVREPGSELSMVMEEIDELLYPETPDMSLIGAKNARTGHNYLFTSFLQEYLRADREAWVWPLETVTIGIEHAMYLGRSAIKQSYKVRIDSSVHQSRIEEERIVAIQNRITSIYYLEEVSGGDRPFLGSIIYPDILGQSINDTDDVKRKLFSIDPPKPEIMTVYDCEQLYNEISELRTLAIYDHSDVLRSSAS